MNKLQEKTIPFSIKLTEKQLSDLTEEAKKKGIAITAVIRWAVNEYFENHYSANNVVKKK